MLSSLPKSDPVGLIKKEDLKILLVDDREENLLVLRKILSSSGAQLIEAKSGSEALALAFQQDFALVLMDVNMPDMSGYEAVSLINSSPRTKNIPVIFVTANNADKEDIHKGFKCGAVDYITKPLDPVVLRAKVRIFLDLALQKNQLSSAVQSSRQANQHNEAILLNAAEGIIGIDVDGKIRFSNPSAQAQLGRHCDQLMGMHIRELFAGKTRAWNRSDLHNLMVSMRSVSNAKTRMQRHDGSNFAVEYSFGSFTTDNESGGVFIFQDITERIKVTEKLTRMATQDPLTGLPNRALLQEVLKNTIEQAKRQSTTAALLFIDLDDFKKINDEMGHKVGDELLVGVAAQFKSALRKADTIARAGGDEFIVMLGVGSTRASAELVAEKFIKTLSKGVDIQQKQISTSCSIGIAEYPTDGRNSDDLLKAADTAMYQVKKTGKNGHQVFCSEFYSIAKSKLELERDLRTCMSGAQLSCFYQPMIDAKTNEMISAEVLVRWQHPKRGWVLPSDFIPVAEETGVIREMGRWIMQNACNQASFWLQQGSWKPSNHISINLSARQLMQSDLVAMIDLIVEKTNLKLENLELEVTETALISNPDKCINILSELRERGVDIAIDDFGTGYSSLSYLQRLPVSRLKIDRSFVQDISRCEQGEKIVMAIIDLAHKLGLAVTAEGVETQQQQDFLVSHGCDCLQGYMFSRPLPAKHMEKILSTSSPIIAKVSNA